MDVKESMARDLKKMAFYSQNFLRLDLKGMLVVKLLLLEISEM
jgi:hypothetical protein